MNVKCDSCGYVADESEFPKGKDLFQKEFIAACPKCPNRQTVAAASMRMFGTPKPFVFIRPGPMRDDALAETLHDASDAS